MALKVFFIIAGTIVGVSVLMLLLTWVDNML